MAFLQPSMALTSAKTIMALTSAITNTGPKVVQY